MWVYCCLEDDDDGSVGDDDDRRRASATDLAWRVEWCGVVSLVVGNGLVEVVVELVDCRDPFFYLLITL